MSAWHALREALSRRESAIMLAFGFASGLPFLLVGMTASIWMRETGHALGEIGLIAFAGLFYVLKFLWAPLLDRWQPPLLRALGRRRGWLLPTQFTLALGLLAIGLAGPGMGAMFLVLLGLVAFASATQDTLVDAWRIEVASVEQRANMVAIYSLGYRFGLIVGGAGALLLAEYIGWERTYATMAALLLLILFVTWGAPEPVLPPGSDLESHRLGLREFVLAPFIEFFRRFGAKTALLLLLFVGLYKLPDQMLGVIAGPFYLDSGFSKAEIAGVSKLYGVWIGLFGALVGAFAVNALGVWRSLLLAAGLVALSNLLYLSMALHPGALWAFVLTISGDNFGIGFAGTALVTFSSGLTSPGFTATQFALLVALANLPGKLIGVISGFLVEQWGYAGFFVFSTVSIVPTLLVFTWLYRRRRTITGLAPRA